MRLLSQRRHVQTLVGGSFPSIHKIAHTGLVKQFRSGRTGDWLQRLQLRNWYRFVEISVLLRRE